MCIRDRSIPAGTPQSLFQTERWDQAGGAEMNWTFPVTPGQYEVRLYFSEIYSGAFAIGKRTFSVQIEGATVLQNYDTYAEVGANAGVVKKFTVTSDANLNINFLHGIEDPAVKAIEILSIGGAAAMSATPLTSSVTTSAPAANSSVAVGLTLNPSSTGPTTSPGAKSQTIVSPQAKTTSSVATTANQGVVRPVTETRKATNARKASDTVLGNSKALNDILADVDLLRSLPVTGKKR